MLKIAYICEPQVGGTYTFFLSLREPLERRGIDFRCVAPCSAEQLGGTRYRADPFVEPAGSAEASERLPRILAHLVRERYDGVMVLPGVYPELDSLPHRLDADTFVVARLVHSARGVYKPAQRMAGAVSRFIAVSDRLGEDLAGYGVASGRIQVIYHGVDPVVFRVHDEPPPVDPLQLLYVGRLEDHQKHVTLLPGILAAYRKASGREAWLTIVGEGPDEETLGRRAGDLGVAKRIRFEPARERSAMADLYNRFHVLVLPSRFEGCGFTLIEAMACGCVPVVSNLKGIFDRIVEDGVSGSLCRVGDAESFARALVALTGESGRLRAMAAAARQRVEDRFSLDRMADDYAAMFREVAAAGPRIVPLPEEDGPDLKDRLRRWVIRRLPTALKDRIRTAAERRGISL